MKKFISIVACGIAGALLFWPAPKTSAAEKQVIILVPPPTEDTLQSLEEQLELGNAANRCIHTELIELTQQLKGYNAQLHELRK